MNILTDTQVLMNEHTGERVRELEALLRQGLISQQECDVHKTVLLALVHKDAGQRLDLETRAEGRGAGSAVDGAPPLPNAVAFLPQNDRLKPICVILGTVSSSVPWKSHRRTYRFSAPVPSR